MPTQGLAAVFKSARHIINHWESVNVALSPQTLILPPDYALFDHKTLVADYEDAVNALVPLENDVEAASFLRDSAKETLRTRPTAFRLAISYRYPDSKFTQRCPRAPNMSDAESRFCAPLDEMATLWDAADAISPLTLPDGTTRAQFMAEITQLRANYRTLADADARLSLARGARERIADALRPRLSQYRLAVTATFGKTSPLTTSLPKLSPTFYRKKREAADEGDAA